MLVQITPTPIDQREGQSHVASLPEGFDFPGCIP